MIELAFQPETNVDGITRPVFRDCGYEFPPFFTELVKLLFRSHLVAAMLKVASKFPLLHV